MAKSINVHLRVNRDHLALLRDIMTEMMIYPRQSPRGNDSHSDIIKTCMRLFLNSNGKNPDYVHPSPDSLSAVSSSQTGFNTAETPLERARSAQLQPVKGGAGSEEVESFKGAPESSSETLRRLTAGHDKIHKIARGAWGDIQSGGSTISDYINNRDRYIYPLLGSLFVLYDFSRQVSRQERDTAREIFYTFWEETPEGSVCPHSELPDRWNSLGDDATLAKLWERYIPEI